MDGHYKVTFVTARSRFTPLKRVAFLQTELLLHALVYAYKICSKIRQVYHLDIFKGCPSW